MHKRCVIAERILLWCADFYTLSREGPIGAGRYVWVGREFFWAPFVARARLVRDFHCLEKLNCQARAPHAIMTGRPRPGVRRRVTALPVRVSSR